MKWTAGSRDNVEDVRGQSGGGGLRMGGLGLGGLLLVLVLSWATGVDFLSLLGGTDSVSTGPSVGTGGGELRTTPEEEKLVDFVDAVMKDAQETWQDKLRGRYQPTRAVIFRDAIQSRCGFAQSATGPFYCPADSLVYLDLGFFAELRSDSRRLATLRKPTCSRTSSAITCSTCWASSHRSARCNRRDRISRMRSRCGWSCRLIALPACGGTKPRSPDAPRSGRSNSRRVTSRKG